MTPTTKACAAVADKACKHEDHAQLRREQILDAAADCFRRRGFHGAGMAEIAKSFGMSASHIYNYFESKEAIIAAIVERGVEEMLARFDALAHSDDIVSAWFKSIECGLERRLDADNAALEVEFLAEATRNERIATMLRAADAKARTKMRDLLKRVAPKRSNSELDACVTVMFAMRDGLGLRGLKQSEIARRPTVAALHAVIGALIEPR